MPKNTEAVEPIEATEPDATEEVSETTADDTERKPSPRPPDPSSVETETVEYGEARVVDVFGVEYGFYTGDDALEDAESLKNRLAEYFNEDLGQLLIQTQSVTKSGWTNHEPHTTGSA